MSQCYRCGGVVPKPDLKEALSREQDWREQFPNEETEERVLICIPCAGELEELEDE